MDGGDRTGALIGNPEIDDLGDHIDTQEFSVTVDDTGSDQDKLPDNWEREILGHVEFNANDNPDGDRLTSIHELLFGTNPLAPDKISDVLEVRQSWNFISIPDTVDNPTATRLFGSTFRGPVWYWQDNRYEVSQAAGFLDYKRGYWAFF